MPNLFMALAPDVVGSVVGEALEFRAASRRVHLGDVSETTRLAFLRLQREAVGVDELADTVIQSDGVGALANFYYCLGVLGRQRFLRLSVRLHGTPVMTVTPTSARSALGAGTVARDRRYVLSRFAWIRRDGDETILESSRSRTRIILHDARVLTLLHTLARPCLMAEVIAAYGALPAETITSILSVLIGAEMVGLEEAEEALATWEFHDLLFHRYSRSDPSGRTVGSTFRFAGQLPAPGARRTAVPGSACIDLFRPDLEQLHRCDPPLARVQDARRSMRDYGRHPITAQQLGEFLYRVARVTRCVTSEVATASGPVPMEFAWRPYPSGGALYELELYPIVQHCDGMAPGLYRYDPFTHRLEQVAEPSRTVEILAEAGHSAGIAPDRLQVVLLLAARFPRVFWKYSGIGYATILKNVGCMYQTMYLAATAMGLAPCAIGAGDSAAFAAATGNPELLEGSVGEFLLGSVNVADYKGQ